MSVLEDVRDHLTAVVAQHDVDKAAAQVKLDAVNAEIAKPVPAPTLDDLKALIAKLYCRYVRSSRQSSLKRCVSLRTMCAPASTF